MFSSEYLENELASVNYAYRMYLPEIGRWTSLEPFGEAVGLNIYSFAENSSPNYFDLLGLLCCGNTQMSHGECCHNDRIYNAVGDVHKNDQGECCVMLAKISLTGYIHENICVDGEYFSFGIRNDISIFIYPFSFMFDSGEVYVPEENMYGKEKKAFYARKNDAFKFLNLLKRLIDRRARYHILNLGKYGGNCRAFSKGAYEYALQYEYKGTMPQCSQ